MFSRIKDFDFYRKIPKVNRTIDLFGLSANHLTSPSSFSPSPHPHPKDLTESSAHGPILSICAATFMFILFVAELWAFLVMSVETTIVIGVCRARLNASMVLTIRD